ncbi:MAG: hypothetical protein FWC79_00895 [Oscillospiraceae bacterium]|nr:hypothetical protein [Oscillospiraceae bacterium]
MIGLIKTGRIDSRLADYDFINARNFRMKELGQALFTDERALYIPENIREQLSEEEITLIYHTLQDNLTKHPVGATTLAIMHTQNGTIDKVIDQQKRREDRWNEQSSSYIFTEKVLSFGLHTSNFDDDRPEILEGAETFEGWTAQDYMLATRIGAELKEKQLEYFIDIFEHPDKYIESDGRTLRDVICGKTRDIRTNELSTKESPVDDEGMGL